MRNLADFLRDAREPAPGATAPTATPRVAYTQPDYRGKVVLVMGSEGRGLRPRVASSCDELIALPLRGRIESLNVSAAAAALLYEILRQRDAADGPTFLPLQGDLQIPLDTGSITWQAARLIRVDLSLRLISSVYISMIGAAPGEVKRHGATVSRLREPAKGHARGSNLPEPSVSGSG